MLMFYINILPMKYKIYPLTLLACILLGSASLFSQTINPDEIAIPVAFDVFDLSKATPVHPGLRDRSWKDGVVPNQDGFLEEFNKPSVLQGPDPVLQDFNPSERTTANILQNFNGQINTSGVAPPDTQGDVSPDYYMQMVNLTFQIFDRNGTSLFGPYDNSMLWQGFNGQWTGTNDGDPIVLYDQYSDRWIASQFALPNYPSGPFYELIAVSQTNDPTGTWNRYAYEFSSMPDYPKFGVWPDGYYMTINRFTPPFLTFAGAAVCIFDRNAMINGFPTATRVTFNLSSSYGSLLPADADGAVTPPTGSPNYLANIGTNVLRIWQAHVDWSSVSSSTLSLVQTLTTSSFSSSGITINQPGTNQTLDPLSGRLMYRLQYRKFAGYEAMVTNHTVNANGSGQAGVRWYELRKYPGGSWSIFQQGTWAPNDGIDRWMASVAMNGNGDIAMGYSASSSSVYPSIRFTGRTAATPPGQMDVTELVLQAGSNSQTGVNRWGDYSMMSIDPVNDFTFWYTTEFSNGGWNWKTKISAVNIGTPPSGNPPVADFSASSTSIAPGGSVIFTDMSTNNPNEWTWSFPGGTPASSSAQNPTIVYNTAGTYSVTLTAANSSGFDTETKTNYISVVSGPVPVADFYATPTNVTVGQQVSFTDQSTNSPISWSWTINGATPSTSTQQNPVVTYSAPGIYDVTLIASNVNGPSASFTREQYITVTSAGYCTSQSTSNATDYISQVMIGPSTYSNGASTYYLFPTGPTFNPGNIATIRLTPNSTNRKEYWRIWIDYNKNGLFTDAGELVFSANNARRTVSGSFVIPSGVTGTSRMRISMKYGGAPTPCETFTNGEVEDYPVTFGGTVAPVAITKSNTGLNLELFPNPTSGMLNVKVQTESDKVLVRVYSALGVVLKEFEFTGSLSTIDVSELSRGLYYIGVEDKSGSDLKKFIKE